MTDLIYNDENLSELVLEGIHWIRQSNGTYKCKYLKNKKCSIYKKRPNLCKIWTCVSYKPTKRYPNPCVKCKNNCCENMILLWDNRLKAGVKVKDKNTLRLVMK